MSYTFFLTHLDSLKVVIKKLFGILVFTTGFLFSLGSLAKTDFITFESGQVRPMALSREGTRLFALNTPDNRLEIFSINEHGLTPEESVVVGLEPVAIAVRNETEVWIVNHLSDSVSVVDVGKKPARVIKTLLVGDEPRDIVFSANDRAFITSARRGQHRQHPSIADVPGAGDPKFTTPGMPRADIWVFDGKDTGQALGGRPLKIIELFGDTPRALALSPDKKTVYAAIMHSGNLTASVSEGSVCPHGSHHSEASGCMVKGQYIPGGIAGPKTDKNGMRAPLTGIIVKQDPETQRFFDPEGRDWTRVVKFSLPDKDVFAIDAASLKETMAFRHVGTTIFNMVTNPKTGVLYVSNTEANNFGLFEGPGNFSKTTVQGHLAESRITVIDGHGVHPRHLNKHIDYNVLPAPDETKAHSLSMPLEMVVSGDGNWLAVAAYGSNKIGIFNTEQIEKDTFDPVMSSDNYINLSGGGPSGLVMDEERHRLYVLTRFNNSINVIDLDSREEVDQVSMFNPEPSEVIVGRKFLYDATITSSNGEASCGSCHIFGDMDHLAWNLGNPDDEVVKNPLPILFDRANSELGQWLGFSVPYVNGSGDVYDLHPMKGPMTTQTFRGMINHGAMHWRGDRATGFFGSDSRSEPPFDSELAFKNFIVAFSGLNGRADNISAEDMQTFADFVLQITMPPNPVRALDNRLSRAQARGRKFYMGCDGPGVILCDLNGFPVLGEHRVDGMPLLPNIGATCEGCHSLAPERGFFGTDGKISFDFLEQTFKVPQLRNVYTKIGMFGNPASIEINDKDHGYKFDQVRGFGVFHDGGLDTITRFMNGVIFNPRFSNLVGFVGGEPQRRDIEEFVLAFDSDLAPVTGQQITLTSQSSDEVNKRIDLLIQRAGKNFPSEVLGVGAKECDLVVTGVVNEEPTGWLYRPQSRRFVRDIGGARPLRDGQLRQIAKQDGQSLTYTCVPYGSGQRIALDRDRDGILNGDAHKISMLKQQKTK